jgi:DNA-binding NarL/FixJ family response regulator
MRGKRDADAESTGWFVTSLGPELALFSVPTPRSDRLGLLTDAELRVASLAALGLSNRAIAARRSCSMNTVANQLANVYSKLGLSGRRELRRGLLPGPRP